MTRLAAVLCVLAVPTVADLSCRLTDSTCLTDCAETSVRFSIDASQFVAHKTQATRRDGKSAMLPWATVASMHKRS
jgi:hypothetical protein